MMRIALFNLVLVLATGAFGGTNGVPWRVPSHTLTARSMSVRQDLAYMKADEALMIFRCGCNLIARSRVYRVTGRYRRRTD